MKSWTERENCCSFCVLNGAPRARSFLWLWRCDAAGWRDVQFGCVVWMKRKCIILLHFCFFFSFSSLMVYDGMVWREREGSAIRKNVVVLPRKVVHPSAVIGVYIFVHAFYRSLETLHYDSHFESFEVPLSVFGSPGNGRFCCVTFSHLRLKIDRDVMVWGHWSMKMFFVFGGWFGYAVTIGGNGIVWHVQSLLLVLLMKH